MRYVEPQGPFLCPACAQRRLSSLRYCQGDDHGLKPICPESHRRLPWTCGGELAICDLPTGMDSRDRGMGILSTRSGE